MSTEEKSGRALTRSLMLAISVGTVSVMQVGCTPGDVGFATSQPDTQTVQALCQRALQTRQVGDIEALLRAAPRADCVAPTLAAMPASTLARLSPLVCRDLPPSVQRQLPVEVCAQVEPPSQTRRGGGEESGGGGGY